MHFEESTSDRLAGAMAKRLAGLLSADPWTRLGRDVGPRTSDLR